MAAAIAASVTDFPYYSGGIIEPGSNFCSSRLNHAVTVVGFEPAEAGATTTKEVMWCRRRRFSDRYYTSGCRYSDEFRWSRYCCWTEETEVAA